MTAVEQHVPVCTWRPAAYSVVFQACPKCGHIDVAHALPADPDDHPGCVICRLERRLEELT